MNWLSEFLLFYLALDVSCTFSGGENDRIVTVATYNVWNIMFNWEVRKFKIAQMVSQLQHCSSRLARYMRYGWEFEQFP